MRQKVFLNEVSLKLLLLLLWFLLLLFVVFMQVFRTVVTLVVLVESLQAMQPAVAMSILERPPRALLRVELLYFRL